MKGLFKNFFDASDLLTNHFDSPSHIIAAVNLIYEQETTSSFGELCITRVNERDNLRKWLNYICILLEMDTFDMEYLECLDWSRNLLKSIDACKAAGHALFQ